VQTRLDWLDSITALGLEPPAMRLPYGEVQECLRFSFGQLPIRMIEEFVAHGRQHLPDEAAGALIYSRSTGRLRLAICEAERASPVRIDYRRPPMASDETVAVDLHTHGPARPSGRPTMTGTTRASRWPGCSGCWTSPRRGVLPAGDQRPLQIAAAPSVAGAAGAGIHAGRRGARCGRDGWVLRLVRRWHRA